MELFQWQPNFSCYVHARLHLVHNLSFLSMSFLPGSLCDAAEPKLGVLFAFTCVGFVATLTLSYD